ncbi:MAG: hypothetical protein IKG94_07450 [Candidatus Methanomethylophilaceae archaeon]|nr:hypothetical protein [Candidatus Methanomethylophilaceae archaeon]MBR6205216.1 hypothetical protein [Candidatus Methanomethylophilaceae archaeon]
MSNGRPASPGCIPFIDQAVRRLEESSPDVRRSTVESYRARLVSVANRLEDMRLPVDPSEIGLGDGRCFVEELFRDGLGRDTVKSYAYALMSYAESAGNHSLAGLDARVAGKPKLTPLSRKETVAL